MFGCGSAFVHNQSCFIVCAVLWSLSYLYFVYKHVNLFRNVMGMSAAQLKQLTYNL